MKLLILPFEQQVITAYRKPFTAAMILVDGQIRIALRHVLMVLICILLHFLKISLTERGNKMELRDELPYGYRAYTGAILADCQVDSYNAIQRNINGFITAGLPVPEYLLNGSHNLFKSYSERG